MELSKAERFHNAYINADEKELDRLWNEEAPTELIKFYPATYKADGKNHFLEHLQNKTLWLSSPSLFNDPFDSVINFDYRNQVEQWSKRRLTSLVGEKVAQEIMAMEYASKMLNGLKDRFQNEMGKIHRHLEESVYTTCFAEKANLNSLRMWGHYANSHAGVCAEYNFCDVNQTTKFACIPIKYTDSYEYLIDSRSVSEQVFDFLKLYTKAEEWRYEKEWRVSRIREGYNKKGYHIQFTKPKRIYLGCKAEERLKNEVIQECEKQGIELYQMTMRPGSFCLDPIRIQ